MRKLSSLWVIGWLVILSGCHETLSASRANDIVMEVMAYENEISIFDKQEAVTPSKINQYLDDLGVQVHYEPSVVTATALKKTMEEAKKDVENRTYLVPSYTQKRVEGYDYHINDGFFYRKDGTKVEDVDEALEDLTLQATVPIDFKDAIWIPLHNHNQGLIQPLNKGPIRLTLDGFTLTGRILPRGIRIEVTKKDIRGMDFKNDLTLTNVSLTTDLGLKKQRHFFALDYDLKNVTSFRKNQSYVLLNKKPEVKSLKEIEQRLQAINQSVLEKTMEIAKVKVPIPQTGHLLSFDFILQLRIRLNGEVGIELKGSSRDGYYEHEDEAFRIKKNNFSLTPYLEGSGETMCGLGVDVMYGSYRLADLSVDAGVGCEAISKVALVDEKEKTVTYHRYQYALSDILDQIGEVHHENFYCDVCADVDVYMFTRLSANRKASSLLHRIGVEGSFTPFKKSYPLTHVENRRFMKQCSHQYEFDEETNLPHTLVLSHYQLFLEPQDKQKITCKGGQGKLRWSSSDASVCSVYQGHLTAKKAGRVTITVFDEQGQKAVCNVVILSDEKPEFTPLYWGVNSFLIYITIGFFMV